MYHIGIFTFLGLDIEAFHREDRTFATQMVMRSELMFILDLALKDSGLYADAEILDRGDGALVILTCSALQVLTEVVPDLTASLDTYNAGKPRHLVLRLRLAVHQGTAARDERGGWIGQDLTFAFRMIESDTMRRQLATTTQPVVLAVSQQVKEELDAAGADIRQVVPKLGSLGFHTKETRATVWMAQLGRCVPA
ncbi:hypothetical protein ACFUYE_08275 [Micromonospora humida]|uniref:hypothetical protein n=1 Tax=Micromonospora humida TaxID=2809018 RepID=UPI00366F1493